MSMRKAPLIRLIGFAAAGVMIASSAFGQSRRIDAETWFEAGLKMKDPARKIENYQKAIKLDSTFLPALYNLGLLYKSQKDYGKAESYFEKASNAATPATDRDLRARLLYELATASRRLGKQEEYRAALFKAKELADKQKTQGLITVELAKALLSADRVNEALLQLNGIRDAALRSDPSVVNLKSLLEQEQGLRTLASTAKGEIEKNNLAVARTTLNQMREKRTGHSLSEARIAEIELLLNDAAQANEIESIYQSGVKYLDKEEYGLAMAQFSTVLERDESYKDASKKLSEAQSRFEDSRTRAEIESLYARGVNAAKRGDHANAASYLQKVVDANAGYKDAGTRLRDVRRQLANAESHKTEASKPATDTRVASKSTRSGPPAKAQRNRPARVSAADKAVLDSLYIAAITAGAREEWLSAVTHFEQIQMLRPQYRDVVPRLAKARANLIRTARLVDRSPEPAASGPSISREVSLGIGAVLGSVIALLLMSPGIRARFHLARRNLPGAILIYESMLRRNPTKIKLYSRLAELYLRTGRKDESAQRVYKMVAQLGLPTGDPEQLRRMWRNGAAADDESSEDISEAIRQLTRGSAYDR